MKYMIGSCKALDNLFGGYQTGVVTQFYGPTKSGKTTLCAYVPIGVIYKQLKKVLKEKFPQNGKFFVIDGDGGFDIERAEQVWIGQGLASEEIKDIESRLIYWQPTEFDQQHKIITKELPDMIENEKIKPLLVVADPLTAIYRGVILRTPHKYRLVTIGDYTGKLDLQLISLRKISVVEDCPVIISSWEVSPITYASIGSEEVKTPEQPMIGGRAFGFIPKCIIELRILREGSLLREAYLYKHRSKKEGETTQFELYDGGVRDITKGGE